MQFNELRAACMAIMVTLLCIICPQRASCGALTCVAPKAPVCLSFSQVKFEASGNGDGGPVSRSESRTVYSSVYEDFCGGQPIQLFFYSALCSKNLLASAGQTMDDEATSISDTPGTTAAIGFRCRTAESLRGGSGSGSGFLKKTGGRCDSCCCCGGLGPSPPRGQPGDQEGGEAQADCSGSVRGVQGEHCQIGRADGPRGPDRVKDPRAPHALRRVSKQGRKNADAEEHAGESRKARG